MKSSRLTIAIATVALAAGGTAAASASTGTKTAGLSGSFAASLNVSTSTPAALATFNRGLQGASLFTQQSGAINVRGGYRNLLPGQSYFTVIYANNNCDPAQAFPVGPFTADNNGYASLNTTVATTVPVSGTMSMSVRRADSSIDEDRDGKAGITDVIAVAGQPAIGLVECNSHPYVTH